MSGIALFIGCVVTGIESEIAEDDLTDFCDSGFSNPDNNEACAQLEKIQRLVIALTVSIQSYLRSLMCLLIFTGNQCGLYGSDIDSIHLGHNLP